MLEGSWHVERFDPIPIDFGGLVGNQSIGNTQARIQGGTMTLMPLGPLQSMSLNRQDSGPQQCLMNINGLPKTATCGDPSHFQMVGLELWGYSIPHVSDYNHVYWVRTGQ